MTSYSTMDDELLCDAWLAVSADFIGRNKGEPFWDQVHEKFHAQKHIAPYDIVGERSNFKNFLRTHMIMVMHSNERGECVHVPS